MLSKNSTREKTLMGLGLIGLVGIFTQDFGRLTLEILEKRYILLGKIHLKENEHGT